MKGQYSVDTVISPELHDLLQQLRRAGFEAPRELQDRILAHGRAAVPALIELATDEYLHSNKAKEPDVWAPMHAIRLLGELEAAEAVEPLIPLLQLDDDWLNEYLPQALGRMGRPAVEPLHAALFDPDLHTWGATAAAHALKDAAVHHPELRDEVVAIFTERLNVRDPSRDDVEGLYGFIISYLCELKAAEALPAIRRAYHDELVDEWIIRPEHVARDLGAPIGVSVRQAVQDVLTGAPLPTERPVRDPFAPPVESVLAPILGLKAGRNDPCTCGSGRKYKKCCGK